MPGRADDEKFMAAAIELSRTHLGQTGTNPSVGCLIVKDGEVVGKAVTAIGGRPHAETQALAEAGDRACGATAYVTLEPCSHFGKTPPCANALMAAGVARVVVSVTDPDVRVSGRGLEMLRSAGIEVETGLIEDEGRRALAGYLMRQTKGRPYVTLKLAVSADGMIGRLGEGQIRITGTEARAEVQKLRAESDAILIGIGTAIADDPELTVRIPGMEGRSPIRIVLDPLLDLPKDGKLASTARQVPVIVVASEAVSPLVADAEAISPETAVPGVPPSAEEGDIADLAETSSRRSALEAQGVEIVYCNPYHPEILLPALGSRGISSLFVEGGAKTAALFLDAGLVDRILLFQGPGLIGAGGIESPVTKTDMPPGFSHIRTRLFGDDSCDEFERGL
ncbi:bifunctional diaminohydroxyphosphoribosylaminopyrimidine deaminase/5-amino-6-(5-phosphoribosylamino)uracil reductase RibD [Rhizobium sp. RAF56]|uniref:bifunctional diaminohydroxyphosphoribosylaminopyrimidine deaminase/5-amino-6-(5-phosphoribosylamino)uracil reductase RibD n=1 Tax=Rhizobium sp. RAF56 TaxID=3233062 RepID=UPI003F9CA983